MSVVRDMVKYREDNNYVRHDMMQLLIQLKNGGRLHDDDETESQDYISENESFTQKTSDMGEHGRKKSTCINVE